MRFRAVPAATWRVAVAMSALASASMGCAARSSREGVTPGATIAGLSSPSVAYREMGFLAQDANLPFVAAVRFLAGPTPDSTLAVFSLSLANNALLFQRAQPGFRASYRVTAAFRSGAWRGEIASDETVWVADLSETRRSDESIVFQQVILLSPGEVSVDLVVRDLSSERRVNGDAKTLSVPRFGPASVAIVPIYEGAGRAARSAHPDLVTNPRAVVPTGPDPVRLYVEVYGPPSGAVTLRAVDEEGTEVWRSTPELTGDTSLRRAVVQIDSWSLPVGWVRIEGVAAGGQDTARTLVLLGYADASVVADFEGVLGILRYFGANDRISQIRNAPRRDRATMWRRFWLDTDSIPETPENEALVAYFSRFGEVNRRFTEGGTLGWLTDRGEVFLRLGEPDEEVDMTSGVPPQILADPSRCKMNCPGIRWKYDTPLMGFVFVFDPVLGRYRLEASSRREFGKIVTGLRNNARIAEQRALGKPPPSKGHMGETLRRPVLVESARPVLR